MKSQYVTYFISKGKSGGIKSIRSKQNRTQHCQWLCVLCLRLFQWTRGVLPSSYAPTTQPCPQRLALLHSATTTGCLDIFNVQLAGISTETETIPSLMGSWILFRDTAALPPDVKPQSLWPLKFCSFHANTTWETLTYHMQLFPTLDHTYVLFWGSTSKKISPQWYGLLLIIPNS